MKSLRFFNLASKIVSRQEGFTLIEAMIGIMIFTVGISAVLYLEIAAINGHTRARVRVNEVHATSSVGEALKLMGWDDPEMACSVGGIFHPFSELPIRDNNNIGYIVYEGNLVENVRVVVATSRRGPNEIPYSIRYGQPRIFK